MSYKDWEPVIGLEIHAQLKTRSKAFSNDSTTFCVTENENISPVSLGLPGALPVLNKKVVEHSIKAGLALNCTVKTKSVFSRKNYFYPDLPKGYQISQFDEPVCENGFVEIFVDDMFKKIRVTRAHIEEDAGKSTHQGSQTLIDLNRAGIALLEIVSEPDIRSPKEAAEYARTVRSILRYIDVCDGNLEEGSLRCDCNVSVRKKGNLQLGTRSEIKNINSFRFIEKAIDFEIHRQIASLEAGQKIVQETRLYDSVKNRTVSMRSKEEAADYRYFPEPDLPPLIIEDSLIEKIKKEIPELAVERARRFQKEYQIPQYDSLILTQEKDLADYFEEVARTCGNAKASSNWVMVEILKELNESKKSILDFSVSAKNLAELIALIDKKIVSGKMAKKVFQEMCKDENKTPTEIVESLGLVQISDSASIEKIIDEILLKNLRQVEEYKSGKTKLFSFFVGQVMKATSGQANPELLSKLLNKKLKG